LWILNKVAEDRTKIVLTVKQQLELPENFKNGGSATVLTKDYVIGIERLCP
jgi:hypothetical protein